MTLDNIPTNCTEITNLTDREVEDLLTGKERPMTPIEYLNDCIRQINEFVADSDGAYTFEDACAGFVDAVLETQAAKIRLLTAFSRAGIDFEELSLASPFVGGIRTFADALDSALAEALAVYGSSL